MFYTTFTVWLQISEEISYKSNIESNRAFSSLSDEEKEKLNNEFIKIKTDILENNFKPFIFYDKEKIDDFYCMNLTHKGDNSKSFDNISEALDLYYKENVNDNSLNQAKSNLSKIVEHILTKSENKLTNLRSDYEKSKEYERYRIEGDLLSSAAYNIKKGQTYFSR